MMPAYKDKLNKDQSDTELLLIDLMHLVELYEYDDEMSLDIIDKIWEAREKRRVIKNELFRVERFQDAVGSNAIAIKTRDALEKIKKKGGRQLPAKGFTRPVYRRTLTSQEAAQVLCRRMSG